MEEPGLATYAPGMPLRRSDTPPSPGVDRHGLTTRRLAALAVAGIAAGAAAAAVSQMPLDALDSDAVDLVGWVLSGALALLPRMWRPRRRARLVWRARVAGLHGFEPGLVARRSVAGWTELASEVALVAVLSLMLMATLPDRDWSRMARLVVALGVSAIVGRLAYEVARFSGGLALTADGIRQGRKRFEWSNIEHARLNRKDRRVDAVYLRPRVWRPTRHERVVGGRSIAVPDERLLAAIDYFRTRPETLAVGLPLTAPEPPSVEAPAQ
jgi:hypothetical protein